MEPVAIHFNELFGQNLVRLTGYYNRQALKQLAVKKQEAQNVHQARLCFKRLRCLLRLGRFGLSNFKYQRLNHFYRDQARALAFQRDISVTNEVLKTLIKSRDSDTERAFLTQFRARLLQKQKKDQSPDAFDEAGREVIHRLSKMQAEISHWEPEETDAGLFLLGIKSTFAAARKQFRNLSAAPSDFQLHEWRKQVKYLWYQAELLTDLWPSMLRPWIKELKALAQSLGRHHDLVLLETALKEYIEPELEDLAATTIEQISEEKSFIEEKALMLGKIIFAVQPSCFYQQLKACLRD
ncbi:MAG: CHAD domain-containing protein [Bacteroidales bacterium]|nr:CHAD domain-containing protein [Bacteroidales bacterium]